MTHNQDSSSSLCYFFLEFHPTPPPLSLQGVFVLYDSKFRWLRLASVDQNGSSKSVADLLRFPCGLIRGALFTLGIKSVVSADVSSSLPACKCFVKTHFILALLSTTTPLTFSLAALVVFCSSPPHHHTHTIFTPFRLVHGEDRTK